MQISTTCKLLSMLLLLAAAVCLEGPGRARAEEPVVLTYVNDAPENTFPAVQMDYWIKEVQTQTSGQVGIRTISDLSLLNAATILDAVSAGRADIGVLNLTSDPGRFMVSNAVGLPWSLPDARSGSRLLLALFRKYQPSEFENLKVLALFTSAPLELITSLAVNTPSALRGVDMRASSHTSRFLAAWGANPVGLPAEATAKALQMGVVKGVLDPLAFLKDLNYAPACPFVTLTDTAVIPFAVVMNQETWNRLPLSVQLLLDDLMQRHSTWTADFVDQHRQEVMTWSSKTHQVNFIQLTPSEKARWNLPLDDLIKTWRRQAEAQGLPADAILADIEALSGRAAQVEP